MDINILRSIATVLSLGVFVSIVAWAYSRRNAMRFKEAAQLPFMEENAQERAQEQS